MAKIREDLNLKEEGYCTKHGYDWCLCLQAMEEQAKKLAVMFKPKRKKKKK